MCNKSSGSMLCSGGRRLLAKLPQARVFTPPTQSPPATAGGAGLGLGSLPPSKLGESHQPAAAQPHPLHRPRWRQQVVQQCPLHCCPAALVCFVLLGPRQQNQLGWAGLRGVHILVAEGQQGACLRSQGPALHVGRQASRHGKRAGAAPAQGSMQWGLAQRQHRTSR